MADRQDLAYGAVDHVWVDVVEPAPLTPARAIARLASLVVLSSAFLSLATRAVSARFSTAEPTTTGAALSAGAGPRVPPRASAGAVELDELLSLANDALPSLECDADIALCSAASCTRHADAGGGVEIAACACQPVRRVTYSIQWRYILLAVSSPDFVELLREWADGRVGANATATRACAALRAKGGADGGGFYYPTLAPDRISLFDDAFDDPPAVASASATLTCANVTETMCTGAPCFDDPTSLGPLNVTCLCPM